MSVERNYRCYVQKYFNTIAPDGSVDLKSLAVKIGITPEKVANARIGEERLRAIISTRLGAIEEKHHDTFKDEETGVRRNPVHETTIPMHNRLVDELYHLLTPPEPPADGPEPAVLPSDL